VLRSFRAATGVTPHQFQTQTRIRRAAALIRAGRAITDAALDVGFADQSHLTRHFTRSMGVPPGRFARAVKNVQDGPCGQP
jgi:AraC-like DNA-binding protein